MNRKTPALMIQGTCSNSGKSVLAAAFCRIFLQDGLRVAPFKAQNMSLNSFVTRDGGEMGRAQVVQAQAAMRDPDVRMNPVLLKPSSDTGAQVIVNGRPRANMKVEEYIRAKAAIQEEVFAAYDSLAGENQVMVLEGAGSPAEVNLMRHDIVNMAMARYAGARVLITGDIDRGGVFASLLGTMEILPETDRALVAGFIINKFRGRRELLTDAIDFIEARTGIPVLGVIDFIPDLGLPEEDSVGFKSGLFDHPRPAGEHVAIGVIDLPHVSNFTDIEPFLAEPDVHLEIIREPEQVAAMDTLIIPGSKNVYADLNWLRQQGLDREIKKFAADGEVVGICGGFQITGESIDDPGGLEKEGGGSFTGLGLVKMKTLLTEEKSLCRVIGVHRQSGLPVHGYEIHHGLSNSDAPPWLMTENGPAGISVGNVSGSYVHGIFDSDPFRRWFIDRLRGKKGMAELGRIVAPYGIDAAIDRLADLARRQVDMTAIRQGLGIK